MYVMRLRLFDSIGEGGEKAKICPDLSYYGIGPRR